MRVLFTSLRNTSHFLPLVPFLEACRQRGHEVAVAAPSDLKEAAEKTGAVFLPFGHPGDAGLRPIWSRIREAPEEEARQLAIAEIFVKTCAGTAFPALLDALNTWRPAIVVRESQEYAAVLAARKLGIPHVRVAITARSAEAEILPHAAPALDQLGRECGLPADPEGQCIANETALTLFPAALDGLESDPALLRRFRTQRSKAAPLPDWWGARGGPLVYATLGTVMGSMEHLHSAYAVVLEAVSGLDARVLLTTGKDLAPEALGALPPNVHVERFVPQHDVLPHAAAIVCHGGSGTLLGALSEGVPLVVTPMFADQPFNAERVAAVGAGLAFPTRAASAPAVRAAVERLLAEATFRIKAREIAAEIAALPDVAQAALVLEELAKDRP